MWRSRVPELLGIGHLDLVYGLGQVDQYEFFFTNVDDRILQLLIPGLRRGGSTPKGLRREG